MTLPIAPWVDVPTDAAVACPDLRCPGIDLSVQETRDIAVEMAGVATAMLWQRTGRRFSGLVSTRAHLCHHLGYWCGLGWSPFYGYGAWDPWMPGFGPWSVLTPFLALEGCYYANNALRMPGAPVTAVSAVVVNGETLDPSAYVLEGDRLARCDGGSWPLTCGTICAGESSGLTVEWSHGVAPPPDGKLAASVLTCELTKARLGDKSALPAAVTSATRQGVTISRDLVTMLARGYTGVTLVDQFLAVWSSNGAGVLFPEETQRARFHETTWVR